MRPLIVAGLFGVLFLASVDNQMLIALLPVLSADLGVSIDTLSLLMSGYALSAGLFNIFLGPSTDRHGRVVFLRAGLALFCMCSIAASISENFAPLLAFRFATGLAAGLLSTCTVSFIGDYFPYEKRGRVMGIVLSSYFAALIFGIPIGALIEQTWSWRAVFIVSAANSMVLFVWLFAFPSDRPEGRVRVPVFESYREILRVRANVSALVTSFAVSGATLSFLTFIAAYLNAEFGLRTLEISRVFVVAGVAALAGSPLAGWLCDRWSKRAVFLWANSLLVLPLVLMSQLPWGASLMATFFLVSLAVAARQTALQTLQTALIGKERRGTFLSLRNGASQLGISVSVLVAGRLYVESGYWAVTLLAAALTLIGSVSLAMFVNVEASRRTERTRGRES